MPPAACSCGHHHESRPRGRQHRLPSPRCPSARGDVWRPAAGPAASRKPGLDGLLEAMEVPAGVMGVWRAGQWPPEPPQLRVVFTGFSGGSRLDASIRVRSKVSSQAREALPPHVPVQEAGGTARPSVYTERRGSCAKRAEPGPCLPAKPETFTVWPCTETVCGPLGEESTGPDTGVSEHSREHCRENWGQERAVTRRCRQS